MASRGSVIPLFVEQVRAGKPITITDPNMTRFMMTLDDAVELVQYAFEHGNNGDIFVQKAPAATVAVLTEAILSIMGKPEYEVRVIGTRHGEKLYEALLSREERAAAEDLVGYFRVPPDGRDQDIEKTDPGGEIGRRSGLKTRGTQLAGSNPAPGTNAPCASTCPDGLMGDPGATCAGRRF